MTFNSFPKIFIICPLNHNQRWNNMVKEMSKFGITNYERIEGMISPSNNYKDKEKAAHLAHIEAIEKAKERNYDKVLILEDDCYFSDNILNYEIDNFLENNKWEIFYLGCHHTHPPLFVTKNVNQVVYAYCLHAYIVNQCLYDKLISFKSLNHDKEYDVWIPDTIQINQKCFALHPRAAFQKQGYSYIQDNIIDYDKYLKDVI